MGFPVPDFEMINRMLKYPQGRIRAVLDTDTFNEIDDQFALTYALLSPEKISLQAVLAAPFFNLHSSGPADGMEKSYEEILRIFTLLGLKPEERVFRGSDRYMPDMDTPVDSPAARRIVELAHQAADAGEVLYVLAIAAVTNVASALLLDPGIARHIVIVWLGGHAVEWCGENDEFNLRQDMAASRILFDSGVPLIQYPCRMVTDHLLTTEPELAKRCRPCGKIGQFLYERTAGEMRACGDDSRVIWDIVTVAHFMCPDAIVSVVRPAPVLNADRSWQQVPGRHPYRCAMYVSRDEIFRDLFGRLADFADDKIEAGKL